MAYKRAVYASATAAIDWVDLKASGEPLEDNDSGVVVLRTNVAARVAVGVADPGTSNSAGVATVAGEAITVMLAADVTNQNIWVQTPADQSKVEVEIDEASSGKVIGIFVDVV